MQQLCVDCFLGFASMLGSAVEAMVLDVAHPDSDLVTVMDAMLSTYGVKPFGVITTDDLNLALGENPDLIVIDVRRQEEVDEKGIVDTGDATFIPVPLEEFIAQKAEWPADMAASIVVYCGSGHRSTMAMTILWTYGYSDVSSLRGGFTAYVEAGYPTLEAVPQ